jgi:hypothetical protein
LVLVCSVSRWGLSSTNLICKFGLSLHPISSSAGLSFALLKLELPEVKVSGSGFHSGDDTGINLCSGFGAANVKCFCPNVLVLVCVDCWKADQQFG